MAKVTYNQRGFDARELSSADLAQHGVEGFKKQTFRAGEAVEVDDAVAELLVNNPDVFGSFEFAKGKDVEAEDAEDAPNSGTSQESVSPPRTGRTRSATP